MILPGAMYCSQKSILFYECCRRQRKILLRLRRVSLLLVSFDRVVDGLGMFLQVHRCALLVRTAQEKKNVSVITAC